MTDPYQLIIPMTGVGQRFVDAGYLELKPLIQTGIGSMIESVMRNHSSVSSPICIVNRDHPQKSSLRKEILRVRKSSRILEISGHKKGPSYAVLQIHEELNENAPSVINYCDFSGIWPERSLIENISKYDGLILTYTGFHPHMLRSNKFAYVKKDLQGRVIDIREKMAFTEDPMCEEASSGTYAFRDTQEMIEALRIQVSSDISVNGEFYTSLTYKPLIAADKDIRTLKIDRFFQWGTPRDLEDFQVWSYSKISSKRETKLETRLESNTVVLAAGSGKRLQSAVNKPKPLLKIFNKEMWNYAAQVGAPTSERLVITRSDLVEGLAESNPYNYTIKGLSVVTQSQVETANLGLKEVINRNASVHVLACDNLTPRLDLEQVEVSLKDHHMVVWLAESYLGAIGQEEQFSWLETDSNGIATRAYIKSKPPKNNAKLIIGNFSFQNTDLAMSLIDSLNSKLDQSLNSGDERHLEFLITEALIQGLKVGNISLPWFAAIGTESEYRIAEYFESALSNLGFPNE